VQVSSQFPIISITNPRHQFSLVAVVRDEEAVGVPPAETSGHAHARKQLMSIFPKVNPLHANTAMPANTRKRAGRSSRCTSTC